MRLGFVLAILNHGLKRREHHLVQIDNQNKGRAQVHLLHRRIGKNRLTDQIFHLNHRLHHQNLQ